MEQQREQLLRTWHGRLNYFDWRRRSSVCLHRPVRGGGERKGSSALKGVSATRPTAEICCHRLLVEAVVAEEIRQQAGNLQIVQIGKYEVSISGNTH